MGLTYYKATADTGGVKGTQIQSGFRGALLPKLTSAQRTAGITIFRKFYVENNGADTISLNLALDNHGEFDAVFFASTGDAQVVGDLTGTETRYGASKVVGLEDSSAVTETVNGAGGLSNIKKIVVTKNTNYVIFRNGESIGIGGATGEVGVIESISDLGATLEITLVTPLTYVVSSIGQFAHAYTTSSLATTVHTSFWLQVIATPNSITLSTANPVSMAEIY